jgi:hypothetical protein
MDGRPFSDGWTVNARTHNLIVPMNGQAEAAILWSKCMGDYLSAQVE